jgi:hypothetical protein
MTRTKAGKGESRVSAALRRAIAADTIGCFVDNAVLAKGDIAVLKAILGGQRAPGFEINLKRALGALARSDKSPEAGEILARVLADEKALPRNRSAAAAYLSQLPPQASEKALLAALPTASGLLRLEVIKALGQVGTAKALAQLSEIEPDDADIARRQLALAKLAIAFREKGEGTGAGELDIALGIRWTTTQSTSLDPKDVREILAAMSGPTFSVEVNPEVGFRFTCGELEHVLLLNKALKRGGFAKGLTKRNLIAGLVVAQSEKLRHFTVRWLLLTAPADDGVRVVLVRPGGEPVFEGKAVADAKGLGFMLRDTGLERTPAQIAGRVADDDIAWAIRVWRGPLRAKPSPRPVSAPPTR